jgi:hypothetical protein
LLARWRSGCLLLLALLLALLLDSFRASNCFT